MHSDCGGVEEEEMRRKGLPTVCLLEYLYHEWNWKKESAFGCGRFGKSSLAKDLL